MPSSTPHALALRLLRPRAAGAGAQPHALRLRLGVTSSGGAGGGSTTPTTRTIGASVGLAWQPLASRPAQQRCALAWQPLASVPAQARVRAAWGQSAPRSSAVRLAWGARAPMQARLALAWGAMKPAQTRVALAWGALAPAQTRVALAWGRSAPRSSAVRLAWGTLRAVVRPLVLPWSQAVPRVAWGSPWPVDVIVVPPSPAVPHGLALRFERPQRQPAAGRQRLRFGRWLGVRWPGIRGTYMQSNEIEVLRAADGLPLPWLSGSLSLDRSSWVWGVSGQAHASALPWLMAPNVELIVRLNGIEWRVIVERVESDRTCGRRTLSVTGRGLAAVLDTPYASAVAWGDTSAGVRMASQIAGDIVPSGWTLDWGLIDWPVPAAAWTHTGTPISALQAIAAAVGGYVQPHRTAQQLRLLPAWPAPAWQWGSVTPDVELPASATQREGISWQDAPPYDVVYTQGSTAGGARARVYRADGAAAMPADTVTDALLTHVSACTARGVAVLSAGGRRAQLSLRVPLLDGIGLVEPGQWVGYVDGADQRVGLCRGVSIDFGAGAIWQTVTVETAED